MCPWANVAYVSRVSYTREVEIYYRVLESTRYVGATLSPQRTRRV